METHRIALVVHIGLGEGDFAWLGREVHFRDGRVVEVFSDTYYD